MTISNNKIPFLGHKKGLEIGQPAPSWELTASDGRKVRPSRFLGRPLLIFFFRGTWCPSCRQQMEQIRSSWSEIEPLARVIGIVGQEEGKVQSFLAEHPLPFPLLSDATREVIEAHNIYQRFGLNGFRIAYPTTLIVDRDSYVRYCYVGQSPFDRPDLKEVMQQLRNLNKA